MYNKLVQTLTNVLPKDWERVVFYSHITQDMYEIFFYVKIGNQLINCFKMDKDYSISRASLISCFDEIHKILLPDFQEKHWFSATAIILKSGKIDLFYDYNDDMFDDESYKTIWKSKYLLPEYGTPMNKVEAERQIEKAHEFVISNEPQKMNAAEEILKRCRPFNPDECDAVLKDLHEIRGY